MKKGHFLPKISVFVASVGLGIIFAAAPRLVAAAAPFSDDFDSYNTTETLGAQNHLWISPSGEVTDAVSDSAPNSFVGAAGNRTGDLVQYGTWYFSLYVEDGISTSGIHSIGLSGATGGGASIVGITLHDAGSTFTIRVPKDAYPYAKDLFTGLSFNEWHRIAFDWAADGYSLCVDSICEINWNTKAPVWDGTIGTGYQKISITNFKSGANSYIDTIDDEYTPTPPPVPGTWPIITATEPADGVTTIVDFDNVNIAGNVQIPTDVTDTWTGMLVKFTDAAGIDVFSREIIFPVPLSAGDDYDYSATTTIAADPTQIFSVKYFVTGYNDTVKYPYGLTYPYIPENTFITETGSYTGGIPLINIDEWEPPALENCDDPIYNFLEKTTCKIQNSLLGLVIPSKESVTSLFGTLGAFQTKFPFSYVSAISSTLAAIRAGVNESNAISITIFGNTGNIDLSFWAAPVTVGAFETSIGGVIKLIMTFFLLLAFLFWALNYLHRIL